MRPLDDRSGAPRGRGAPRDSAARGRGFGHGSHNRTGASPSTNKRGRGLSRGLQTSPSPSSSKLQNRNVTQADSSMPAGRLLPSADKNHPRQSRDESVHDNDRQTEICGTEAKYYIRNLPKDCGTEDVFLLLKRYGTINHISVIPDSRKDSRNERAEATVTFNVAPHSEQAMTHSMQSIARTPALVPRVVRAADWPRLHESPVNPSVKYHEKIHIGALSLDFGVMKQKLSMLALRRLNDEIAIPRATLNLKYKCLDIDFRIDVSTYLKDGKNFIRNYRMRVNFPQITEVHRSFSSSGECALVINTSAPPCLFLKPSRVLTTHDPASKHWTEEAKLQRQTGLHASVDEDVRPTGLRDDECIVDIGRWLTYRLVFSRLVCESPIFKQFCNILTDYTVPPQDDVVDVLDPTERVSPWTILDDPSVGHGKIVAARRSAIQDLHQLTNESNYLSFPVRYQLESCLSHRIINESSLTLKFLRRLSAMPADRATKLLELCLDRVEQGQSQCYENPEDIFRFEPMVSTFRKKIPRYCTMIRSAVITPTTIYFSPPVPETSNRVVRRFQQFEDRFLRVKFTDERYKGRIWSGNGMDKVYARVDRTMKRGIRVGDRTYEFLAFGSSQFREGGAYFFASSNDCSAQHIRDWMGNFSDIRIVAKYCARLGQSFTTTRPLRIGVTIKRISDILSPDSKHMFTDGVGKVSPFIAQMIAQEFGMPNSTTDFPSVFQFRLGGCKGVLAVDPSIAPNSIEIRPSQEKFSAMQHHGLEICRISQFSAANLNIQLILVLSALGVSNGTFLRKMSQMLDDLETAMHDENKAVELLQKNIDYNQSTIKLAQMIQDGFMNLREPFTVSCLRLWRSWSVKYLREKARIFIEKGAFVLGCVDERCVLRGHFNESKALPEIFIQVPDRDKKSGWKVITGKCMVARNPSLHPGDVRVVMAVDKPELRHLRDCVVFPQTGDRDVPNMLSGGDLDGDDFLVIWDEDILPREENQAAMDYSAPPPFLSDGPVTVDDMTSFFVRYMRDDNLSRIAVAHRYWADFLPLGVKDPKCKKLAELHSCAVDFPKTGISAVMRENEKVKRWPHWSEARNKPMYISKTIIGQLYDAVQHSPFAPAWEYPFDVRILQAYKSDQALLITAAGAKQEYDRSVRRLMAKFGIDTEFEIWTTFVLKHSNDLGDYKFSEKIGEAVATLKETYQENCYELAGTTRIERDRSKMDPFIVAMYQVTAEEVESARARHRTQEERSTDGMPFMSFPWIFSEDLGRIARQKNNPATSQDIPLHKPVKKFASQLHNKDQLGEGFELAPLPEVRLDEQVVPEGNLLDLFHQDGDQDLEKLRAFKTMLTLQEKSHEDLLTGSPSSSSHGQVESEVPAAIEVNTTVGTSAATDSARQQMPESTNESVVSETSKNRPGILEPSSHSDTQRTPEVESNQPEVLDEEGTSSDESSDGERDEDSGQGPIAQSDPTATTAGPSALDDEMSDSETDEPEASPPSQRQTATRAKRNVMNQLDDFFSS